MKTMKRTLLLLLIVILEGCTTSGDTIMNAAVNSVRLTIRCNNGEAYSIILLPNQSFEEQPRDRFEYVRAYSPTGAEIVRGGWIED